MSLIVTPTPAEKPRSAKTVGAANRRFIYGFLAAAVAASLLVGGLNFIVNPLGYYPTHFVKPLSWGDQLQKLALMPKAPTPQVLILGSSRTMKLAPADVKSITGKTAFNGGVSSSRPEEWYSMLRYALDDLHWPVEEIVLGIDMETLFYNGEPNEDLMSSAVLHPYLPAKLLPNSMAERSKLLLSWSQTKLSAKSLKLSMEPPAPPEITFDSDGYLHYVTKEQAIAQGNYTLVTIYQVNNYQQRYAGAADFNPMRRELFEQALDLAKERGIRVRAFFTPFHPSVLAEMEKLETYTHVHAAMTDYAKELTSRYPNLTIRDFTEVEAFGGDPANFFDGVHYRQENARQIMTELYRN